jgi:hypothetical protein
MTASSKRGRQSEYNKLLDTFNGREKGFTECVDYLIGRGFSPDQANDAVHVYRKGGATEAKFKLAGQRRDELLDEFNAVAKTPKECVDYLRSLGCTYRQATSAVYKYRQERGLIAT